MSAQTDLLAAIRAGMAPTWLDRTISRWAPGWGVRRLQDRITLAAVGGYAWSGARRDLHTLQNFNPVNQSPEDEQRCPTSRASGKASRNALKTMQPGRAAEVSPRTCDGHPDALRRAGCITVGQVFLGRDLSSTTRYLIYAIAGGGAGPYIRIGTCAGGTASRGSHRRHQEDELIQAYERRDQDQEAEIQVLTQARDEWRSATKASQAEVIQVHAAL